MTGAASTATGTLAVTPATTARPLPISTGTAAARALTVAASAASAAGTRTAVARTAEVAARCEAPRGSALGTRRAVLGEVDAQRTTAQVSAVQHVDALLGRFALLEFDERKSARTPRCAVGGNLRVEDCPCGTESREQLLTGYFVAEVSDENLVRNGMPL